MSTTIGFLRASLDRQGGGLLASVTLALLASLGVSSAINESALQRQRVYILQYAPDAVPSGGVLTTFEFAENDLARVYERDCFRSSGPTPSRRVLYGGDTPQPNPFDGLFAEDSAWPADRADFAVHSHRHDGIAVLPADCAVDATRRVARCTLSEALDPVNAILSLAVNVPERC